VRVAVLLARLLQTQHCHDEGEHGVSCVRCRSVRLCDCADVLSCHL
jgi:hypothetical protein